MTRAIITWPSGNSTPATSAVWTTCAAVRTFPSLEISTPDPKPSMIPIGSSTEGAISIRLVLTMTTAGLTLRKASRSCCAFVVIDNVENVSRVSTKANGDLILIIAANRNNRSRPKHPGLHRRSKEKGGEKRNSWTVYCVFREYITRDSTMLARRITRLPVRSSA
jgi:hypothetical protein